MFQVA